MATYLSLKLLFVIWILDEMVCVVWSSRDGDFDYDELPGTQHEFKIEVSAGKEECFAQKVASGAMFHVQYEVCQSVHVYL